MRKLLHTLALFPACGALLSACGAPPAPSPSPTAFSRGRLFTFENGRIVPYAPAEKIVVERIEDVDGDGVVDLFTHGPFDSVEEACGSGFGYRIAGPLLLAHGMKDGTFSLTDDAAIAHAKKECPTTPASVLVKGEAHHTSQGARNIACMLLRGATPAAINAKIARECPPLTAAQTTKDPCAQNVCNDPGTLRDWAAKTPPLVVK